MALNADDRIILVRVKIERAKKHLRDLATELLAVQNVTIPSSRHDAKPIDSRKYRINMFESVLLPKLPVDAIATAGDLVHNLRSTLDHLAHQLVIVGSGKEPSRRVEFPIAKDINRYQEEKARKVEGMRPEAVEAIDKLKPYKGGNDALWRIHELDNIDKHRTLFSVAHDYLFYADWLDWPYRHNTDTPHFAGIFDEQVERDVQLEIDKAVTAPKSASGKSLLPTLHHLVDVVEDLVPGFKPFLE
ncbi:MAG: hypothetical protein NVS9B4_22580 [Candidatus Acidiferrum sp.]